MGFSDTQSSGMAVYFDPNAASLQKYPTDQALSTALIHSYGGSALTNVFGAPITWPKDLNMMVWARAVMDYFNRDIPVTANGSHWNDRRDLFFFDAAVNYFKKFQYRFQYTQADCDLLNQMIPALDQERESVLGRRAAGAFGDGEESQYLTVIDALKQKLATAQAQLNCANVISNESQQQVLGNQLAAVQQAQSTVQTHPFTTYLVYGVIGVAVLVAVIVIVKK
ncbi:MAG TPA: hypothetical protein VFV08_07095 [Puia sp.]|nr:hypothetical protein [Puia sp.]